MNILVLKSYGIGNVIMATPMIKALHKSGHNIFLLADTGPLGGPTDKMLEGWECVEEIKPFNTTREKNGDVIISWIFQKKIDLCIQSYPGDSIFDWLYPYLNCPIRRAPKPSEIAQHEVEYNLDLVKDLVGEDESQLYNIPHHTSSKIDSLMAQYDNKIKIILCPSFKKDGGWAKKNWGVENYAKLINILPEDCQPILVDGPDGIGVCNYIKHHAPRALNMAGLTSIQETVALMNYADIVIANDSGPAHIAAALDKILVVFFGPTSTIKNRPINPKTIILKTNSPDHKCAPTSTWDGCFCIKSLPPETVYNALVQHVFPELDKEKKVQPIGV
jgi:ADP-heptose:LPS heptosyltransferase